MTPEQRADRVFFITATEGVEAQNVIRLEIVKQIKWAVGEAVADAESREQSLNEAAELVVKTYLDATKNQHDLAVAIQALSKARKIER